MITSRTRIHDRLPPRRGPGLKVDHDTTEYGLLIKSLSSARVPTEKAFRTDLCYDRLTVALISEYAIHVKTITGGNIIHLATYETREKIRSSAHIVIYPSPKSEQLDDTDHNPLPLNIIVCALDVHLLFVLIRWDEDTKKIQFLESKCVLLKGQDLLELPGAQMSTDVRCHFLAISAHRNVATVLKLFTFEEITEQLKVFTGETKWARFHDAEAPLEWTPVECQTQISKPRHSFLQLAFLYDDAETYTPILVCIIRSLFDKSNAVRNKLFLYQLDDVGMLTVYDENEFQTEAGDLVDGCQSTEFKALHPQFLIPCRKLRLSFFLVCEDGLFFCGNVSDHHCHPVKLPYDIPEIERAPYLTSSPLFTDWAYAVELNAKSVYEPTEVFYLLREDGIIILFEAIYSIRHPCKFREVIVCCKLDDVREATALTLVKESSTENDMSVLFLVSSMISGDQLVYITPADEQWEFEALAQTPNNCPLVQFQVVRQEKTSRIFATIGKQPTSSACEMSFGHEALVERSIFLADSITTAIHFHALPVTADPDRETLYFVSDIGHTESVYCDENDEITKLGEHLENSTLFAVLLGPNVVLRITSVSIELYELEDRKEATGDMDTNMDPNEADNFIFPKAPKQAIEVQNIVLAAKMSNRGSTVIVSQESSGSYSMGLVIYSVSTGLLLRKSLYSLDSTPTCITTVGEIVFLGGLNASRSCFKSNGLDYIRPFGDDQKSEALGPNVPTPFRPGQTVESLVILSCSTAVPKPFLISGFRDGTICLEEILLSQSECRLVKLQEVQTFESVVTLRVASQPMSKVAFATSGDDIVRIEMMKLHSRYRMDISKVYFNDQLEYDFLQPSNLALQVHAHDPNSVQGIFISVFTEATVVLARVGHQKTVVPRRFMLARSESCPPYTPGTPYLLQPLSDNRLVVVATVNKLASNSCANNPVYAPHSELSFIDTPLYPGGFRFDRQLEKTSGVLWPSGERINAIIVWKPALRDGYKTVLLVASSHSLITSPSQGPGRLCFSFINDNTSPEPEMFEFVDICQFVDAVMTMATIDSRHVVVCHGLYLDVFVIDKSLQSCSSYENKLPLLMHSRVGISMPPIYVTASWPMIYLSKEQMSFMMFHMRDFQLNRLHTTVENTINNQRLGSERDQVKRLQIPPKLIFADSFPSSPFYHLLIPRISSERTTYSSHGYSHILVVYRTRSIRLIPHPSMPIEIPDGEALATWPAAVRGLMPYTFTCLGLLSTRPSQECMRKSMGNAFADSAVLASTPVGGFGSIQIVERQGALLLKFLENLVEWAEIGMEVLAQIRSPFSRTVAIDPMFRHSNGVGWPDDLLVDGDRLRLNFTGSTGYNDLLTLLTALTWETSLQSMSVIHCNTVRGRVALFGGYLFDVLDREGDSLRRNWPEMQNDRRELELWKADYVRRKSYDELADTVPVWIKRLTSKCVDWLEDALVDII